MKKSDLSNKVAIVLAMFILCWLSMNANATPVHNKFIYVTGANGKAGSSAELTLNLHSDNPICSWACDLILPEGFTFKSITAIKDRFPEGYEADITTEVNKNGSVSIFWDGTENMGMTGSDGAVAIVTVEIADTVSSGKYMVKLEKMKLVELSVSSIYSKTYTEFKWPIMGSNLLFVEEGKVWNMRCHRIYIPELSPDYDFNYFIEGDTLISNLNCMKLYAFNESNDGLTKYKMALYESEGKVYFIPSGSTESFILYDFMIPEGESTITANAIHPEWEIEMRNNEDKLIEINDVSRHCLLVNRVDASFEDYPSGWWIEGIGSELGPLNTWGFEANGNSRFFVNCEVDGQEIFNLSDFCSKLKEPDYDSTQKYFPEGTKWTEIRLDTLKYDSWYSKVDGEWVPNFETIEYNVGQEALVEWISMNHYTSVDCVYTNGPEWTDSLAFTISEEHTESDTYINASIEIRNDNDWPEYVGYGQAYQFNWSVDKELYYQDMIIDELLYPDMVSEGHHSQEKTGYYEPDYPSDIRHPYGTIEEIKERDFGGTKPLKYVDLDGIRIVHGIGVTEWNDGECLFGPLKLYANSCYFQGTPPERHYRSMLVRFERDGEVLYDVWPETNEPVTFTAGQIATMILPTEPDASKGKYYRLDRYEDGQIIFEQELQPQAHIPYIIVPNEDFSIDLSTLDLAGCYRDTVSVDGISFIGSYVSETFDYPDGFYIDFIDITHDCRFEESCVIGALRAYLLVRWDDPYNQGGTRVPPLNKRGIVLRDYETGITSPLRETGEATLYDLQGRMLPSKPAQGIYIKNRQKVMVK